MSMFGAILLLAVTAQSGDVPQGFDRYGGWEAMRFEPRPWFDVAQRDGRWWFVTPAGHGFLSIGVCCLHANGDREQKTNRNPYREALLRHHGTTEQWAKVTLGRLRQWGFNTRGAWSGDEVADLPYTLNLSFCGGHWQSGDLPDFFSDAFAAHVAERAAACSRRRDDPMLIGYYLDNELQWAPDWRVGPSLFARYVAMPPDAPGKQRLIAFMRERYETVAAFNAVWADPLNDWQDLARRTRLTPIDQARARADREAFVAVAARQYFQVTTQAVRAVDPNHLILGCRFVHWTVPRAVVEACGEYSDVISVNFYEVGELGRLALDRIAGDVARMPGDADLRQFHALTGKPVLITEFAFRAMDSGMPNTIPPPVVAQPVVATQRDRAQRYDHYVTTWLASPYIVGCHWFKYTDEPPGGRFDGENGNYGLVNNDDQPYTDFVNGVTRTNAAAWSRHREAAP